MTPSGARRAMAIVVVAAIVVGGVVAGGPWASREVASAVPAQASAYVDDAPSNAWFCAAGTAAPGGQADEWVGVANVGGRVAHTTVSVMPGVVLDTSGSKAQAAPGRVVSRPFDIAPAATAYLHIADLAPSSTPGIVVESADQPIVVTHKLVGTNDVAFGPCARRAQRTWYFAAGSTDAGADVTLVLFDPYPDDAVVDVSFVADDGLHAPSALQGLVVPARSTVDVNVASVLDRQSTLATIVNVRRGRAVAEEQQVGPDASGGAGLALTLGAAGPAGDWSFPDAGLGGAGTASLALLNPSGTSVRVRVVEHLDGEATLTPDELTVGPQSVLVMDPGTRVPPDIGYWVSVQAVGAGVVAQLTRTVGAPAPVEQRGRATMVGLTAPAYRWEIAPARTGPTSTDTVAVVNPGRRKALVSLLDVTGAPTRLDVPAGRRVMFALPALPEGGWAAGLVTVRADVPVFAVRTAQGAPGVSLTPLVLDVRPPHRE